MLEHIKPILFRYKNPLNKYKYLGFLSDSVIFHAEITHKIISLKSCLSELVFFETIFCYYNNGKIEVLGSSVCFVIHGVNILMGILLDYFLFVAIDFVEICLKNIIEFFSFPKLFWSADSLVLFAGRGKDMGIIISILFK